MDLFEYVGNRIRELRTKYAHGGISQEALAKEIGVATNTISRWETATYHPTIDDLDKLGRFFAVSILEFFPREEEKPDDEIAALLRAARKLDPKDIVELRRYAEYRRVRGLYGDGVRVKPGRKRKESQ
jgi:transcriptional regulator with XRE-family HTH domain